MEVYLLTLFLLLIRIYQITLSPFMGHCCRFFPTCSEYGLEALQKHGPFKGSWLTIKRVCRCHPLCKGGPDLVP